jgi:UPF0755 protein
MNNKLKNKWVIAAIVAGAIIVFAGIFVYYNLFASQFQTEKKAYVYIDRDDTPDSITVKVERAGMPRSMNAFKWLMAHLDDAKNIHTGRYLIKPGDGNYPVFRRLTRGQQAPLNFSINDIRTCGQLAEKIGNQLMIDSSEVAIRLNDSAFCSKLGFKKETVISLFIPNTYEIYWNISTADLFKKMKKEYNSFWSNQRLSKAKSIGFTPSEVCTIASIVEEETNNTAEKPMVAGLYINRLHKGMKLQADPTVKFAVQNFTIKRVTGEYLRSNSPYNTYKFEGLPPGPIRIPSIKGIDAVLNYTRHNFVYMCAKEDFSGTHNFAATWEEHMVNARKYQAELNKRKIF